MDWHTLTEIKSKLIGPNCHAYISVRINTTTSIVDFDLSHYITDFNTKNIETWNEFNNRLTDQIVNGYTLLKVNLIKELINR